MFNFVLFNSVRAASRFRDHCYFMQHSLVSHILLTPCSTPSSLEDGKTESRSLSREDVSPWDFIAKGAIDAALAIGPIFFFSKFLHH
jgi:hypothetical protein